MRLLTALQPELLHELELEFVNSRLLLATAAKRGDENSPEPERAAFDELMRAFVNNARILARNAAGGVGVRLLAFVCLLYLVPFIYSTMQVTPVCGTHFWCSGFNIYLLKVATSMVH